MLGCTHPKDANCVETPLHGAASCQDDVTIDALLDLDADIEVTRAILTGDAALRWDQKTPLQAQIAVGMPVGIVARSRL